MHPSTYPRVSLAYLYHLRDHQKGWIYILLVLKSLDKNDVLILSNDAMQIDALRYPIFIYALRNGI